MTGTATWMAEVLRAAGLEVVEHAGWQERSHGDFAPLRGVLWHHDASPKGDSPGVPAYMVSEWDNPRGSANAWVSREGVWHLIAAGVAWHAGNVKPGCLSNHTSLGIETDHTVGEDWPPAQLEALRRGTAALMPHTTDELLDFHKLVCDPPGRKVDPDGLDITTERRAVAQLVHRPAPAPAPSSNGTADVQLPIVNTGSARPVVQAVQALLNEHGYASPALRVDGAYGPHTAAAVNACRHAHGAKPGPVDASVWRVLLGLAR